MKVCVVTPWYPDRLHSFSGIFVRQQVDALRDAGVEVEVEVAMRHSLPAGHSANAALKSLDRLASRDCSAVYGPDPSVSYIPSLEAPAIGFAGRAEAFAKGLQIKRKHRPIDADVVHAHVALPAAYAALTTDDRLPVVVTEHFTGLQRVLRQADAALMYQGVVEVSAQFAFVSQSLSNVLTERYPRFESQVQLTPNIVDLREIPFRPRSTVGTRWLYVGNLTDVKGIKLLLRSFRQHFRTNCESKLTVVGQGPLEQWAAEFIKKSSLADAVTMAGSVEHAELGPYFDEADLLVHLSELETFGISTMEAIGAGLPVINLDNGAAREVWGEIESAVGRILPLDSDEDAVCSAVDDLRGLTTLNPAAGRAFVERRFSPKTVAQHLITAYEGVI